MEVNDSVSLIASSSAAAILKSSLGPTLLFFIPIMLNHLS
ncbi:hypothetical protein RVIR1_06180 [Candidatus Rickettsiella viridis]|uniref:Uncharacterized protein n=1 Tax=Candidatus Rickettsiella viridis TaxID=676208 RepID=A0A2Z5UUA5_9COXI|nr:hypothetical protein RVIR1_06180 [Candidatus Rickettsiella viridis]